MQHEILVSETHISNFMNCHAVGSFDQRKTENTQWNNIKIQESFSFLKEHLLFAEIPMIVLLELFCFPFSESSPLKLWAAPSIKKNAAVHIPTKKYINKICFALLLVPTGQQTCVCVCMCLYVLCMEMCWLVLQALVEIDGGGVGTGLSYPLLQLWFQPAHAHRAAKRQLNMIWKMLLHFGKHFMCKNKSDCLRMTE